MPYILTYYHTRQLFLNNKFKPFVRKYFKNPVYLGSVAGRYDAELQVDNWEEVKNILPKYAKPDDVKFSEKRYEVKA